MSEIPISVTEAARNFAEFVDLAHSQNQTFVLLKNGVPVARLGPVEETPRTGHEIAAALAKVKLSPAEAGAWSRDFKKARKTLKRPRNKWQ
jgi:antitoxin (DNA-binding transcriptional repressor) of toxin-antitoxin stability system